jgi:hypothetical protein
VLQLPKYRKKNQRLIAQKKPSIKLSAECKITGIFSTSPSLLNAK